MGQVSTELLYVPVSQRHIEYSVEPNAFVCVVQNLALNIAEKGFSISVFNRSSSKTDATVERAQKEGTQ